MSYQFENENTDLLERIMDSDSIHIGNSRAHFANKEIGGKLISFENESFYKISNYDAMRPFFMSIVSDSNHWMFISSTGGLSAGRKNSDCALFPYYTDDKISESHDITGNKTIIKVQHGENTVLWEPFSKNYLGVYDITRNLYKSRFGNKIIFEEINNDLKLTYRYQWNSSNLYGFVKKSKIINNSDRERTITLLDGIQNIVPFGVGEYQQNNLSNLVDAYKRNELLEDSGIGIYALSAIIVDKAEPSEALKSSVAWSSGIEPKSRFISSLQLDNFRRGVEVTQEKDIKAEKGAYFVVADLELIGDEERQWLIAANVNQSMTDIAELAKNIKEDRDFNDKILADIELGTRRLVELNAAADGMQISTNRLRNTRHFANTLFNIMRGGIFDNNYQVEKDDFVKYIANSNKKVYKKKEDILNQLPDQFSIQLIRDVANQGGDHNEDKNFKRLCFEYMPLKFSRRHGDPSRPWNKFSINTRSEVDGSKVLDYEGNWRDIFQNWEALAHSYPEFVESMIFKFLNASTFDGYNPYRVMKNGFDWETIEPDDPWSYIGYWGDHQIIYLLKFLEFIEDHYPGKLQSYFDQNIFVYANVPYKIKGYSDILRDPKDTIVFDDNEEAKILRKREEIGVDGALLRDQNYFIYKVNFIEKILATVLAKVSNFIPEAGIWMNTQRPEWNDANNALVGNGVSMVTLYYLRRFLKFFEGVLKSSQNVEVEISAELKEFFNEIHTALNGKKSMLESSFSDESRKTLMDELGNAGSNYRNKIYDKGFADVREEITIDDIRSFVELTVTYLEHSIHANKRNDELYHSYNLISLSENKASVSNLPEMLEGQVAVLSSGSITGEESLKVLEALKNSTLFREDQYSYILYPNKDLPGFVVKNNIPKDQVEGSKLLMQLVKDDNTTVIQKDVNGNYHFNGGFNNAKSLESALSKLDKDKYGSLIKEESTLILNIFEEIFDHKSFTGRSGTFFGYEGLGSIYWHMVSKLLLAVQETCIEAVKNNEPAHVVGKLFEHYYEINEGIGVHKSPELYGAFPTDPYSHTPLNKGAQQPGMTGQVKEDILCRFGELGVSVKEGRIQFSPFMLRKTEFLKSPRVFNYININKELISIDIDEGAMAFTYCQVPVIYKLGGKNEIEIIKSDGSSLTLNELLLDKETSRGIFRRTSDTRMLKVSLTNDSVN